MRTEKDSMGEIRIPDDALYGAQTARAVENFKVLGRAGYSEFIYANQKALEVLGAKDISTILGKNNYDFFNEELAENLTKVDKKVIESQLDKITLEKMRINNQIKFLESYNSAKII